MINDRLREMINLVFKKDRPSQIELRYANGTGLRDIEEELLSRILCKEWNEVTAEDWRYVGSLSVASHLLTPTAMAYYVPSLLVLGLDDELFMDFALEALVPANEKRAPRGEWWTHFMNSFNAEQKTTIRAFIDYAYSNSPEGSAANYLSSDAVELWRG